MCTFNMCHMGSCHMLSTVPGSGDGEEEGKKSMAFALEEHSEGRKEQEFMMHY